MAGKYLTKTVFALLLAAVMLLSLWVFPRNREEAEKK